MTKQNPLNNLVEHLQEHLLGEVMTNADALKYFSTDGGVFQLRPQAVVYPRNTNDVRKVARFTWQLAEKGHILPITARGKGTDQAGAALGSGLILAFPAHMNKVLGIDKKGLVTLQPGVIYAKLEQALHAHGLFLPPYPSSIDYSTVGGAIANNASGEKTVKYGSTRDYVTGLLVVLANGELIETKRLNKRQLNAKKGQANFEGQIYRDLDNLINDHWKLIQSMRPGTTKNSAGYALGEVKRLDGSFDLTPLFVGSQGTLGVITQATLKTAPYNPSPVLLSGHFDDLAKAEEAVIKLRQLKPSALEMVDSHLLDFIHTHHPKQLAGLVSAPFPKLVLLIEFDDPKIRTRRRKAKQARKILTAYAMRFQVAHDAHEREALWKIRHSAAAVIAQTIGTRKALPIIEDGIVPPARFLEYINRVYAIFAKYNLEVALWGHAGDANLHMQPFLDLGKIGDRQLVFKIADEYYKMVISLGGSTSGEHNDGRLRAPYLPLLFGDAYQLLKRTKAIFDPYGTLNPGVKIDVHQKDLVPLLRSEYSMEHLYDHMPRT